MRIILLFNVVETIVNGLSILFNGFLLYLIKNHSSFGSPVYQTLLAIDASLDHVLSICVLVVQPICLTGGGYKVYFSDGYLAGLSDELDRVLLWVYFFLMFVNVMWIGIQFVCRYVYLCVRDRRDVAKRIVWTMATVSTFCAAAALYMGYVVAHPGPGYQAEGLHALALNQWDTSRYVPVVTGSHISSWTLRCWLGMWTTMSLGCIATVAVCEVKIQRSLRSMGVPSHDNTRKMHKEFHRALLAMAICPLVTSTGPILYFITAACLQVNPGPNQAFMTVVVSSITMFNPLTTICFIRSYREFVLRPFSKNKPQVHTTRVTGLSMATSSAAVASSAGGTVTD